MSALPRFTLETRQADAWVNWMPRDASRRVWRVKKAVVAAWNDGRSWVRSSGQPYRTHLGVAQDWGMFSSPPTRNGRLHIAVQLGGQWTTVFRERSAQHAWRRSTFDHYRWRETFEQFHRGKLPEKWTRFGEWIAERAFEDYPAASGVRVWIRKADTPPPYVLRSLRRLPFNRTTRRLEIAARPS
jgi:hypothetical protein